MLVCPFDTPACKDKESRLILRTKQCTGICCTLYIYGKINLQDWYYIPSLANSN